MSTDIRKRVLDCAEHELAIRSIRNSLNQIIAFSQFKAEHTRFKRLAGQRLCAGELSLTFSRIAVGEVKFFSVLRRGDLQGAVTVVLDLHGHIIDRPVVVHALGLFRNDFLYPVLVFAHVSQRVGDRAERELAFLVVLHRLDDVALSVGQLEAEHASLKRLAGQRLRTAELHFAVLSIVAVGEVERRSVLGRGDLQGAVAVVLDLHGHGVNGLIVGHAAMTVVDFLHRVGVFANVSQRIGDLAERKLAVSTVLDGLDDVALGVKQLKAEHISLKLLPRQRLAAGELHFAVLRIVTVGEVELSRVIRRSNLQRAVAVVLDLHGHGVNGLIVGHAAMTVVDFLHRVGVFANVSQRIGDLAERNLAVRSVLHRLDDFALGVDQHEAEHLSLKSLAGQRLHAVELHFAISRVDVVEIELLSIVGSSDLQRTVAVVFNLHGHNIDSLVISNAALGIDDFLHGIGMSTDIRKRVLDCAEHELAIRSIRNSLNQIIAFSQFKAEHTRFKRLAGQRLCAGELSLTFSRIAVGEVKFFSVLRRGDLQGAVTVVLDLHGHIIDRPVVVHALGLFRNDFLYPVLVFAHVSQRVGDRAERELAVRTVLHGLDDLAVSSDQLEAEHLGLERLVFKDLAAGELRLAFSIVAVGEVEGIGILSCGQAQRSVTIVNNGHFDLIDLIVVGHARHFAFSFLHSVGESLASIVKVVLDRAERELAVLVVLHGLDDLAVSSDQLEAEHASFKSLTGQRLRAAELDLTFRRVDVIERRNCRRCLILTTGFLRRYLEVLRNRSGIAITIVSQNDEHVVHSPVITKAIQRFVLLIKRVSESNLARSIFRRQHISKSFLRKHDRRELDRTVSSILFVLNRVSRRIFKNEGKLVHKVRVDHVIDILDRLNLSRNLQVVRIEEIKIIMVFGRLNAQRTVCILHHIYSYGVSIRVTNDSVIVCSHFTHEIGMFTEIVDRVHNRLIVDRAVRRIGDALNKLFVFPDLEREHIVLVHFASSQRLVAFKHDFGRRPERVFKQDRLALEIILNQKLAVALIGNGQGNCVNLGVVVNEVIIASHLIDRVDLLARITFIEEERTEVNNAVFVVGNNLNDTIFIRKDKGELILLKLSAIVILLRREGILALGMIGVGERSNRRFTHFNHTVSAFSLLHEAVNSSLFDAVLCAVRQTIDRHRFAALERDLRDAVGNNQRIRIVAEIHLVFAVERTIIFIRQADHELEFLLGMTLIGAHSSLADMQAAGLNRVFKSLFSVGILQGSRQTAFAFHIRHGDHHSDLFIAVVNRIIHARLFRDGVGIRAFLRKDQLSKAHNAVSVVDHFFNNFALLILQLEGELAILKDSAGKNLVQLNHSTTLGGIGVLEFDFRRFAGNNLTALNIGVQRPARIAAGLLRGEHHADRDAGDFHRSSCRQHIDDEDAILDLRIRAVHLHGAGPRLEVVIGEGNFNGKRLILSRIRRTFNRLADLQRARLGDVLKNRNLIIRIDVLGDVRAVLIGHLNENFIRLFIVGDIAVVALLLDNDIGIFARTIVVDRIEDDFAVDRRLGVNQLIGRLIRQRKLKHTILRRSAVQQLRSTQANRDHLVDEHTCIDAAGDFRRNLNLAGAVAARAFATFSTQIFRIRLNGIRTAVLVSNEEHAVKATDRDFFAAHHKRVSYKRTIPVHIRTCNRLIRSQSGRSASLAGVAILISSKTTTRLAKLKTNHVTRENRNRLPRVAAIHADRDYMDISTVLRSPFEDIIIVKELFLEDSASTLTIRAGIIRQSDFLVVDRKHERTVAVVIDTDGNNELVIGIFNRAVRALLLADEVIERRGILRIEAHIILSEGDRIKEDLAVSAILRGVDQRADRALRVAGIEFELELVRLKTAAVEQLGSIQNEIAFRLIFVDEFDLISSSAVLENFLFNVQRAVAVVGNGHIHGIHRLIKGIASLILDDFLHLVGKGLAMISLGVEDAAEEDLSGGADLLAVFEELRGLLVAHRADHFAVVFAAFSLVDHLEAELTVHHLAAGQVLHRIKSGIAGGAVDVGEHSLFRAASLDLAVGVDRGADEAGSFVLGHAIGALRREIIHDKLLRSSDAEGIAAGDLAGLDLGPAVAAALENRIVEAVRDRRTSRILFSRLRNQRQRELEFLAAADFGRVLQVLDDLKLAKRIVDVLDRRKIGVIKLVLGHVIFFDRVNMLHTTLGILFKILEGIRPVAVGVRIHRLALNILAVAVQIENDGGRAEAERVVAVIPGLDALNGDRLLRMDVDQAISVAGDELHLALVALNRRFFEGVDVADAVLIDDVKLLKSFLPVIFFAEDSGDGIAAGIPHNLCLTRSAQDLALDSDGNALRTHAIMIVVVVPDLLDGNDLRHDAHAGVIVIDDTEFFVPMFAGFITLPVTQVGVVVGVHIVRRIGRRFPVDDRSVARVGRTRISALRDVGVLILVVIRGDHLQIRRHGMIRLKDEVFTGRGLGRFQRHAGHIDAVRHSPAAIFVQLGLLPDVGVVQIKDIHRSPGVAGGVNRGIREDRTRLIDTVIQLRSNAGGNKVAQVNRLERTAPLTLALPGADPVLAVLNMLVILHLVGILGVRIVVFKRIEDDNILRRTDGRGNAQTIGVAKAFVDGDLLLSVKALRPDADKVIGDHLVEVGSGIGDDVDADVHLSVDKAVFVRLAVGIQARERVGDILRHVRRGGVVAGSRIVRFADLTGDGTEGSLMQTVNGRLERHVVRDVSRLIGVQIAPGVHRIESNLRLIRITGHRSGVIDRNRRQIRLDDKQNAVGAIVVGHGIHVGNRIARAQLDRIELRYDVFREEIVEHAGGFCRNHAGSNRRFVVRLVLERALLGQNALVMQGNLLTDNVVIAAGSDVLRVIVNALLEPDAVTGAGQRRSGVIEVVAIGKLADAISANPAIGIHGYVVLELGFREIVRLKEILNDTLDALGGLEADGGIHIPADHGRITLGSRVAAVDIADKGMADVSRILGEDNRAAVGNNTFTDVEKAQHTAAGDAPGRRGSLMPLIIALDLIFDLEVRVRQRIVGNVIPAAGAILVKAHLIRFGDFQRLELEIFAGQRSILKVEEGIKIFGNLLPAESAEGARIEIQLIQRAVGRSVAQFFEGKAAGFVGGPGVTVASSADNEVHVRRFTLLNAVERIAVKPILVAQALRPLVNTEVADRASPSNRRVEHGRVRSFGRHLAQVISRLPVGFSQSPLNMVVEVVNLLIFSGRRNGKLVLSVGGPHIDRLAVHHAIGRSRAVIGNFRFVMGVVVGNGTHSAVCTEENAVGYILAGAIDHFIRTADSIFNFKGEGLVVGAEVVAGPADIDIVLRIGARRQIGQLAGGQYAVVVLLKDLTGLVSVRDFGNRIHLSVNGIAGTLNDVAAVRHKLNMRADRVADRHIHNIHRQQIADRNLEGVAGSRANGAGVGQHIIAVNQLPVEVRLGGRRSGNRQIHRADHLVAVHSADQQSVFVHRQLSAVPDLRRNRDADVARLVVILTGELHLDLEGHRHLSVAGSRQEEALVGRRNRIALVILLAVFRQPLDVDAHDLGTVAAVGRRHDAVSSVAHRIARRAESHACQERVAFKLIARLHRSLVSKCIRRADKRQRIRLLTCCRKACSHRSEQCKLCKSSLSRYSLQTTKHCIPLFRLSRNVRRIFPCETEFHAYRRAQKYPPFSYTILYNTRIFPSIIVRTFNYDLMKFLKL